MEPYEADNWLDDDGNGGDCDYEGGIDDNSKQEVLYTLYVNNSV
jgi:hypothetical protein